MRRFGAALAWSLIAGSLAMAGPATPEELIGRLGASDFRFREAAAQSLESLGDQALPAMRKAQPHADPEIRQRLVQLISRVERATLLAPRLVSVKADQQQVTQVFADLAKLTGYNLICQQGNNQLVSLRVDNVPFWEAIDLICKQSGHGLQPYYDNSSAMTFYRTGRFSPHVHYAGPFRLAAGNFHLSKTLDLNLAQQANSTGRPRTESLTFTFHAIGEPKTPLMSLGQPRVEIALDDLGNSLVPPQNRTYDSHYQNYYNGYRNPMLQTQVQLLGYGNAQTLKHLKGTLPLTFLAETRPEITVEKILTVKGKKFEGGQISLEIDDVKENGKQVSIKATARRGGTDNNNHDYSWTNSLAQRIELVDERGDKFRCDGFNWDSGTPTAVTGTFLFGDGTNGKLGKASKLIYYTWVTSQYTVDFEFRDLPLP